MLWNASGRGMPTNEWIWICKQNRCIGKQWIWVLKLFWWFSCGFQKLVMAPVIFNMLVMNPPLPLKTFSKLQGHQLATRLIHVVWKLQSNSSYYDGGPIFCPRVNCKVEKETRSLRFMPSTQTYRESCKKHSCQALGTASWTVAPQCILWVDSRTFWGWLSQRNRTVFT